MYVFFADLMAGAHLAYVLAVVVGLVLTLVGGAMGWRWVGNRWFRVIHLAMIAGVVARALLWDECPLTWWERDLRELGGQVNYEGSSVGYLLHAAIHPTYPIAPWVYLTVYSAFAVLVASAFWFVPVRWRSRAGETDPTTARRNESDHRGTEDTGSRQGQRTEPFSPL
jgi:hypothetical protein